MTLRKALGWPGIDIKKDGVKKKMNKHEYKCVDCGLEIIIIKSDILKMPIAECQECGTRTMRPTQRPFHDKSCECKKCV